MANMSIEETKGGNLKYILSDLNVTIYAELRKKEPSAQIKMRSKELDACKITGQKTNPLSLYLGAVPVESQAVFCKGLANLIESLAKQGLSIQEIGEEVSSQYRNDETTKTELVSLQKKFKEINKEFKQKLGELEALSDEMDYICKQMEML